MDPFNPGTLVPDEYYGRLHEVGIAKEYDLMGYTVRRLTVKTGQRFDREGNVVQ
jgi:hypothetical protein